MSLGFRLPPVRPSRLNQKDFDAVDVLPVVRFPQWLQCPAVQPAQASPTTGTSTPASPSGGAAPCTKDEDKKIWVVPVRFIVACEDGHLGEFPWKQWAGCDCATPALSLDTRAPGLGGKVVRCATCKIERSLEGVFARHALRELGLGCSGNEPWLAVENRVRCGKPPRVLQRGASNVYWGDTQSALDIPPFSPDPSELFGIHWASVREVEPSDWPALMKMLAAKKLGKPATVLLARGGGVG